MGLLAELCTQESLHLLMPCHQPWPLIQHIIPESHRQQGHRQTGLRPGFQGPRTGGRDGHITDTHLRPRAGQVPQDLREARKGPHCTFKGQARSRGCPHLPNSGDTPAPQCRVNRGRPPGCSKPTPGAHTSSFNTTRSSSVTWGLWTKALPRVTRMSVLLPSLSLGTCVQTSRADLVMWWRVGSSNACSPAFPGTLVLPTTPHASSPPHPCSSHLDPHGCT